MSSKCYYWIICVGCMRCDKLFYYENVVESSLIQFTENVRWHKFFCHDKNSIWVENNVTLKACLNEESW